MIVFVLGLYAFGSSACDDNQAVCDPYYSTLIWKNCDVTTVPGYCCMEKDYFYECYYGDSPRYVHHFYLYEGTECPVNQYDNCLGLPQN